MCWEGFCLFTIMCFGQSKTELNHGISLYYGSDNVNKMSLVLDLSKRQENSATPMVFLGEEQLNALLIHSFQDARESSGIKIKSKTGNYEHLIIIHEAKPQFFCDTKKPCLIHATSLLVFKSHDLINWDWLTKHRFKYVRIDNCFLPSGTSEYLEGYVLSKDLIVLTLVNNFNLDPWEIRYSRAPKLRELIINDHKMNHMRKRPVEYFRQLTRLDLQNNGITSFEEGFFEVMPKLIELNLERNKLKTFDATFMSRPQKVYLDDNPLRGDEETCRFLTSAWFAFYNRYYETCRHTKSYKRSFYTPS